MRLAAPLLALLTLAGTAPAGDVAIKIDAAMTVRDFLAAAQAWTGRHYLYCDEDVEGRVMGGPYALTVPEEKIPRAVAFLLGLQDLGIRSHGPISAVLGPTPRATKFRLTGLEGPVEFNRPPAAWRRGPDAAGSLTPASVERLAALIAQPAAPGRAAAVTLLGVAGPRDLAVAEALAKAVESGDAAVGQRAADALVPMGWAARPVLDRLRKAAEGQSGPAREALDAAIKAIETAPHPGLLNPKLANEEPPAEFKVKFHTTKGDFTVHVQTKLAPIGAKRFYNLVRTGYLRDIAFFRVLGSPKFGIAQFGIHGDPAVNAAWRSARIKDEPVRAANSPTSICFAKTSQRHSRSVQFFINITNNANLDRMGFAPFGHVVEGMPVVRRLHSGYGERGPSQQRMQYEGNEYVRRAFPELDYIKSTELVK
jgi:cyclophilin family peptidyl-prolyl cis-trans isomerase